MHNTLKLVIVRLNNKNRTAVAKGAKVLSAKARMVSLRSALALIAAKRAI